MSWVSIYSLDLLEGIHVGALCQHVVLHISQQTQIRACSLALGPSERVVRFSGGFGLD